MTPEQVQAIIDASIAAMMKVDTASPNTLIFFGGFMAMVVVIVSLSLVFVVIGVLRVQTLFLNKMTERSVMANEQIRLSTDTQTQAITGQTNAISAMNQTGLTTGAAIAGVDQKVSLGLEILKLLGVDVADLAKHASAPTAATKEKVDDMADKADQKAPTAAPEQPAAPAPALAPGDKIEVTGTVTGTVSGTVAPKGEAVPT